jgi:hypothetical protein
MQTKLTLLSVLMCTLSFAGFAQSASASGASSCEGEYQLTSDINHSTWASTCENYLHVERDNLSDLGDVWALSMSIYKNPNDNLVPALQPDPKNYYSGTKGRSEAVAEAVIAAVSKKVSSLKYSVDGTFNENGGSAETDQDRISSSAVHYKTSLACDDSGATLEMARHRMVPNNDGGPAISEDLSETCHFERVRK